MSITVYEMTDNKLDLPDKPTVGSLLSNESIRGLLRARTPRAIERLSELLESENSPVALGAAKTIVENVLPKLSAMALTDEDGKSLFAVLLSSVTGSPKKD